MSTCPTPGVAKPLDGAAVAVVPEGAVVAGLVAVVVADVVAGAAVVGAAVVGVWNAVVGVGEVAGVDPPPIGGWVSGTVVWVVVATGMVVVLMRVGAVVGVVGGAAVVVLVVCSPFRTSAVAMPAPRTPRISTISAMVRSRLRVVPPELSRAGFRPNDYAA
jgi:hypothetical protein